MKHTSLNYNVKMAERCRPCSHIRISLISGGTTYTFTDRTIQSAQKQSDIDPLSRRAPKENFTFSIFDYSGEYNPSNPSGKWSSLDENAEITVEFGLEVTPGTTEWLAPDKYLLDARPTVSGGIATFKASSRLCHLTNTYYKGTFASSNLYDLAVAVLTDAGISQSGYSIDSSLSSMTTNAPLPVSTHLNCLQLISHAGLCTLHTVSGVITITPFSTTQTPTDFIIGLDSIALNGDTISKIETLYKVSANLYVYVPEDTVTTLSELVIDVSGETECHIEYPLSTDQTITVSTGATISNCNVYGASADFTLTGTGSFNITVTGKKINTSVSTMETVVSLNTSGSTDSEKNQLITTAAMQYALIYHAANYLQYRLTHTVKYRGNPELEPLDCVFFETMYDSYITGVILTHTINYSGALSGTLTLKSVSEINEAYLYDANETVVVDSDEEKVSLISLVDYESDYTASEMDSFITEVLGE